MSKCQRLPRIAAFAVAGLIGILSAGCGSNPSSETGATSGKAGTRDRAVRFAECLRNNGIDDFPDPDAKGEFAYGVSKTPAEFSRAVAACKELEPPGALSTKRSPKEQSASLRFAQCMRDDGVKDFPDPVQGEPLINTYKIPSSNQPGGMTILNAAIDKCRSVLGEALEGR